MTKGFPQIQSVNLKKTHTQPLENYLIRIPKVIVDFGNKRLRNHARNCIKK